MTVGLPGTGIGGLFYILLSGFMPFYHLFRMAKGGHKPHHLRTCLFIVFLSAGILAVLYGEAKLLLWLSDKVCLSTAHEAAGSDYYPEENVFSAVSPALALLPFIILFLLLLFVQVLRLFIHGFKRKPKDPITVDVDLLHVEKVA